MSSRLTWLATAVAGATLLSQPAQNQRDAANVPALVQSRIARIEGGLLPGIVVKGRPVDGMRLAERMAFYKTPGVSVCVINDNAIEWAKGYGVAERGATNPVTPRTKFQAASISKPVAAMAALRLVQQGKLALDEDVNARLVSWKVPESEFTARQKVTLRGLLSHSAGLTVHGFPGYQADVPVPTLIQVLDGVKPANTAPIRVDVLPGRLWRYSGGGYAVLQQLLIDVTGKPFPALVSELVLEPTGMADSTCEQPLPPLLRSAAASGHLASGQVVPGKYHTYPELAAAGLWTTPSDLARLAREVQRAARGESALLTQATAREMLKVQQDSYGLGLSLSGSGPDARFGHGGSNEGFRCQLVAFVEKGQGAAIMTNSDRGGRLAQEILRSIAREYGWPGYAPIEKAVAQVDPRLFGAFEGRYEIGPGHVVTVSRIGDRLFVLDRDEKVELFPESETRFFELVEENTLEFVKGPDGSVSHVLIGTSLKARRLPAS